MGLYFTMRLFHAMTLEMGRLPQEQVPIGVANNIGSVVGMIGMSLMTVYFSTVYGDNLVKQADRCFPLPYSQYLLW